MRFAIKKLTRSDLTFFEYQFRRQNAGHQKSINLNRSQVYIANVIKCRAPGNRDPLPTEINNCNQWLDRQIELISPKIIVTLGRYSMAKFFPGKTISKIHGTAQKWNDIVCFAMYHPAAGDSERSPMQE